MTGARTRRRVGGAAACLLALVAAGCGGSNPGRQGASSTTPVSGAAHAPGTTVTSQAVALGTALPLAGRVVALDPGHDGANASHPAEISALVPAGGFLKPCDTTGTATPGGYPEHAFTYDVALRTAALLRAAGATVVLTRHTDAWWGPCVDRRAQIGNAAHAAAAVSIHADGGPTWGRGYHVLEPGGGPGRVNGIVVPSKPLGHAVRDAFHAATGMPTSNYLGINGIQVRSDLAGLNLSTVPKVFVECGNMRNDTDARLLASPSWRQKAARGIAAGITAFLRR